MKYSELAAINVNEHVEKKMNLSYLSWAWAVDTLLRHDENAWWVYTEPTIYKDGTMMVFCTVTAFGRSRTSQLPVMDYKNKPIPEPDAFQVNVAMQRCLAKAIALHGVGLYIYSGEDIPFKQDEDKPADKPVDKPVEKPVDKPVEKGKTDTPETFAVEMSPPAGDEAAVVDWIVTFVGDWITGIKKLEELRDFWKVNKSVLSRVEKFSKPRYREMEENFKRVATILKEAK